MRLSFKPLRKFLWNRRKKGLHLIMIILCPRSKPAGGKNSNIVLQMGKEKTDGWLIYPAEACSNNRYSQSKPPMVASLFMWGNYGVFMVRHFYAKEKQMFAGRGYAVSYFNPRGSSSYGRSLLHVLTRTGETRLFSRILWTGYDRL